MSMIERRHIAPIDQLMMPGSKLAILAGCKCTSEYNRAGRGTPCRDGWAYEVSPDCKLPHHIRIGACEHAE